jgi:hypothetical protein
MTFLPLVRSAWLVFHRLHQSRLGFAVLQLLLYQWLAHCRASMHHVLCMSKVLALACSELVCMKRRLARGEAPCYAC